MFFNDDASESAYHVTLLRSGKLLICDIIKKGWINIQPDFSLS
ncbi:hypothetical protein EC036_27000 [Enterobacter cloacae]|uniref:Uncharacterized protein n=1 Tax=Enterobacter cloacae subsp. cloacae (strain ATCC 13047 / DSM 30054 / NBRC 13535 / NCTC 10005 / WDCM 00083 / NCDC 279-56) TaxID=716541 RepID=A0A0H3CI99_ENTCC|nr:hypothetical protein ECL_01436 [Enterobacter cloacae subsp. cloacae ATCC 13047]AIV30347.1 hypothetical protein EC036_27000 [Enterobacter cloacae]